MRSRNRSILIVVGGLCLAAPTLWGAAARNRDPIEHLRQVSWEIDPRPVLSRGGETAIDRRVGLGCTTRAPPLPSTAVIANPHPRWGGWVICDGDPFDGNWRADTQHSPFRRPEQLTPAELTAGLGVNFWRHHLLVTPQGRTRIFFNSGKYGSEQMYSLVPRD